MKNEKKLENNYEIKYTKTDLKFYHENLLNELKKQSIIEKINDKSLLEIIISVSINALDEFTDNQYNEKYGVFYKDHQNKKLIITESNYSQFFSFVEDKINTALNNEIHLSHVKIITDHIIDNIKSIGYQHKEINEKEKKYNNRIILDEKSEIEHIINFIKNHWEGLDNFDSESMLKMIWNDGLKSAKKLVDEYTIFNVAKNWNEERNDLEIWKNKETDLSFEQIQNGLSLDYINNLSKHFIFTSISFMKTNSNESWDYEEICNKILKKVKKDYPEATKARPLNWKFLEKDYKEYDGMEEYNKNITKKEEKEFKGINSSSAGSYSFPKRISLAQVMYDDKEQFRKPLETLVGAIIGHIYAFNCQNNTTKIINDINNMKEKLSNNIHYQTIVQEIKFVEEKTNNPFEIDMSNYNYLTKEAIKHIEKHIEKSTPEEIDSILKKENKKLKNR